MERSFSSLKNLPNQSLPPSHGTSEDLGFEVYPRLISLLSKAVLETTTSN